jgi:hypothetical protein
MAPRLTIGQVAKSSGVAAKTIRSYEQIGVLRRVAIEAGPSWCHAVWTTRRTVKRRP